MAPVAILIAVGLTVRQGGRRPGVVGAWAVIGVAVLISVRGWDPSTSTVASGMLRTVLPGLLGALMATRERLVAALRAAARRAEEDHRRELASARQAERARLADEMHDLVTHRVSLMVLAADALRRSPDPQRGRATALMVREHGVAALDELRELLGLLHAERTEPTDPADHTDQGVQVDQTEQTEQRVRRDHTDRAERASAAGDRPEPSAADVPVPVAGVEPRPRAGGVAPDPEIADLVEAAAAAGTPVRLDRTGEPGAAPLAVRRALARVVQEALTNGRKHAPGEAVRVELRYEADLVRVEVVTGARERAGPAAGPRHLPDGRFVGSRPDSDGRTAEHVGAGLAATGSGRGLAALRRRVGLLGGTLHAGPLSDGGFQVLASLPLGGAVVPGGSERPARVVR
ncbi:signal transduction histidine kinase [Actinoalloteichus hoggarensis]|uniref:histidine kinase n=1 Tax=Actinoalloteichus hoggarensis TaxID=1470176 RepID=A0A221W5M8_9PSEU|nr:histidine kinase [Actinoalloteichus hoggarensis]ASO21200.1 Histidine kinase [Actinoalloteichus hoggarensis]MBB5921130.1 signal transduction histidine kinase [Actinoalloteichus hoggarensis]